MAKFAARIIERREGLRVSARGRHAPQPTSSVSKHDSVVRAPARAEYSYARRGRVPNFLCRPTVSKRYLEQSAPSSWRSFDGEPEPPSIGRKKRIVPTVASTNRRRLEFCEPTQVQML